MLRFIRTLLRRTPIEPQVGPQGEEYEAQLMERRWQENRARFAENVIKKAGHRSLPFLDDPFS